MDTNQPIDTASLNNIAVVIVGVIAGPLARALTALLRKHGSISGNVQTKGVAAALSALVTGAGGFATGIYGYGVAGVLRALGAAALTYLTATGAQAAAQDAASSVSSTPELKPTQLEKTE